ncbi:hypothetical protein MMC24_002097 [Lignoscripta atroalba]|nr:hypothetical protein [Lignoscripta atroalba]
MSSNATSQDSYKARLSVVDIVFVAKIHLGWEVADIADCLTYIHGLDKDGKIIVRYKPEWVEAILKINSKADEENFKVWKDKDSGNTKLANLVWFLATYNPTDEIMPDLPQSRSLQDFICMAKLCKNDEWSSVKIAKRVEEILGPNNTVKFDKEVVNLIFKKVESENLPTYCRWKNMPEGDPAIEQLMLWVEKKGNPLKRPLRIEASDN